MEELKPCPFCGGKVHLERSTRGFWKGESCRLSLVRCPNCEARGPKIPHSKYGKASNSWEADKEAVEAWNRRVK